jgi:steroid 5-alpha reductase family enzyme
LQYLALAFGICLVCSTLGYIRVVYFVSLSYAASIAAQAVAAAALYSASIAGWPVIQVLLLLAYGIRLGSYLTLRNLDRGFQDREAIQGAKRGRVGTLAKFGMWICVAALYVLMALPAFLTLSARADGLPVGSLPYGIALMAIGLGLESVADWQKFRFKAAYPTRFCNTGLYRIVRCPNYLGEMLFWIGLWFSATSAYQGWLEWGLCILGLACILGIMIGATRRLEGEQADHYAADLGYATYRKTVPVLFPFLPLYSLRTLGGGRP